MDDFVANFNGHSANFYSVRHNLCQQIHEPLVRPGRAHTTMTNPSTELPRNNTDYFKKEYWDDRFAKQEVNNWLVTYDDVKDQLSPYLTPESKILVVECGN